MKNLKNLSLIILMLLPFLMKGQTGALNPNSTTVVLTANQSIIKQVVEAAKDAGKKPTQIPVEVLKTLTINSLFKQIGNWLSHEQICECFSHWSTTKKVNESGTITITFILVEPGKSPTPSSPRITVPFFAIVKAQASATMGGSGASGYIAPTNANGDATMSLDLFGDGEYVLRRMECP